MNGRPGGLPPGPREPAILQLLRWVRSPVEQMEANSRRFGDVFTLRLPWNPPIVFFSSPQAVKDIFTGDADDFRAGEANQLLESVLGPSSLLLMDGARHRRERKLMMPPFHGERMRAYGDAMRAVTERVMRGWPMGRPFAIHPEMQAITLEVILRTVFGLEAGPRLERMRELLVRFSNLGTSKLGTRLLLLLPAGYARAFMNAGMDPIRLGPARLDLSSLLPWRELVRATREVDELLYAEIAARRGRPSEREDVLSMLLQARDEEGREMSDVELHDEMLTLLLAGHETTATTLAWTVHQLCRHPDVLRRVVLEQRAGGDELLDAVIKESMRLIPIVAAVGRKLARPARIGDTDLPAGVVAVACMWLAHRRPDSWPDPERFDPDRFVGRKPDPYQFFPFGGGPRRCLGMAFAGYEMKVVLATMLRRVSFEAASGEVRVIRRGITFAPSGGVPVRVQANV